MYCTAANVVGFLQLVDGTGGRLVLSATTRPTLAEVELLISNASDYIDNRTNFAWREKTVVDEFYDYYTTGLIPHVRSIHLRRRKIRPLDTARGDRVDVWEYQTSGAYTNFLTAFPIGRENRNFWLDYERGILHFMNQRPRQGANRIRMSYRWGDTVIPHDIREACIKLTAIDMATADDYSVLFPEGTSNIELLSKVHEWKIDVEKILDRHKELIVSSQTF